MSDIEHEPWRTVEYGNLALVRAVKKRPCLYNNTIPEYSQKDVTRAAWEEIAEEFGCSAQKLKKKWKILRIAYFRKKNEQCFTHKKKPYYLDKHMSFLLPFTHSRNLLQKLASLCSGEKNNSNERTYCERAENEINTAIQNIKDVGSEVVIEDHTQNFNSYVAIGEGDYAADESNYAADESNYAADEGNYAADEGNFAGDEGNNAIDESNVDRNNDTPIVTNRNTVNPIIVQIPSCPPKQRYEVIPKIIEYKIESLIKPKYPKLTLPKGENIRSKFMSSLLPEIYELSDSEFCAFKRKALKLIDDVRLS